jgi:hypothetical protein
MFVKVGGEDVFLRRSEVGQWCDEWFWSAFDVWWRWKIHGTYPFGGGWAEIPAQITEVIDVMESAYIEVKNSARGG